MTNAGEDAPVRRTPPKVPRPTPIPVTESPAIAALATAVAAGDADALTAFWTGPAARTPLVEPLAESPRERIVTFLWQDDAAEAVLLFVNRLTDERDLDSSLMRRLPGTDLWHLSFRMDSDWRASYSFLVQAAGAQAPWIDADDQVAIRRALDRGLPDPRNPQRTRSRDGLPQSVAELPSAPPQSWLHPRPEVPHGELSAQDGPGGRRVWVYAPAAARDGSPLLVFFDGEVWTGPHDAPTTLDNLIAEGALSPSYALFVDSGGRERRWGDLSADGGVDRWIVDELLPWARERFPLSARREDVTLIGQSLGGLSALLTLARQPDAVGRVLSQSASLWQEGVLDEIRDADLRGTRAYVEVGRQEWVLQPPHAILAGLLRDAGAALDYVEFNGGHDYACWRGGLADGLRALG